MARAVSLELGDKFWRIELKGAAFTTTAGKLGKAGHTKIKELASSKEAKLAYEAAIAAKLKEGYAAAGGKAPAKAKAKPAAARPVASDKLAAAIERAKKWMAANGAAVLVKNLAKPASEAALAKCEKALGFALPPELAALWRIHDGQKEEMNGFIGSLDLLGSREAPNILEYHLSETLDWMLDDEDMPDEAELKPAERNKQWVPFGTRDSDHLVVHAVTGRVFRVSKDAPPFSLEAKSLTEFFTDYAKGMTGGDYTVEPGFGDVYLAS